MTVLMIAAAPPDAKIERQAGDQDTSADEASGGDRSDRGVGAGRLQFHEQFRGIG
jgi:hypothetical protein